jgi:hypothetical protein
VTDGAPRSAACALDHLVYAARDLGEGIRRVETVLGVRARPGGRHEGRGTRNALVGLGADAYLEIVGVDTGQPAPSGPRWLGVDDAVEPRLATWCVRLARERGESGDDALQRVVAIAAAHEVDLGAPTQGSRRRPDGTELAWTFTDPGAARLGGVVPFFIDWGESAHPASALESRCASAGIVVEHPEAERVRRLFAALGVDAEVRASSAPGLVASIRTPRGVVVLR